MGSLAAVGAEAGVSWWGVGSPVPGHRADIPVQSIEVWRPCGTRSLQSNYPNRMLQPWPRVHSITPVIPALCGGGNLKKKKKKKVWTTVMKLKLYTTSFQMYNTEESLHFAFCIMFIFDPPSLNREWSDPRMQDIITTIHITISLICSQIPPSYTSPHNQTVSRRDLFCTLLYVSHNLTRPCISMSSF